MANVVLLIDDEPMYFKMVERALKSQNYDVHYEKTGMEGIKNAAIINPDVIIIDVRLPDMTGFDVATRLRSDPRFKQVPIMFLTAQSDIHDKVKAFEVGADDYLTKPFAPEELVVRVNTLNRRGEALRSAQPTEARLQEKAAIVAVHSLRGGVGSSTMAVNLAMAYYKLWEKPTLIIDGVLHAGQVSLMLNSPIIHSWENITSTTETAIDEGFIDNVVTKHKSGIKFLAAPNHPMAYDSLSEDITHMTLDRLNYTHDFVVIDTAHDFSNFTINLLFSADHLLLMVSPDIASIRAAVSTYKTYIDLGFDLTKVRVVLNNIHNQSGIKPAQIVKVLEKEINYSIPYDAKEFLRALNFGEPYVESCPDSLATEVFEDMAYDLSKEYLKNVPPVTPTNTWKQVSKRNQKNKKKLLW